MTITAIIRICFIPALLLIAACSGDSRDRSAEQNIVNIYNWADYVAPDTLRTFEAEYGIKVNYDIYDSSEVVDVKLLAGNSGYDVVVHSNQFSSRLAPIGVFEKLDRSRLRNIDNLDPEVMASIDVYEKVTDLEDNPLGYFRTGTRAAIAVIPKREA